MGKQELLLQPKMKQKIAGIIRKSPTNKGVAEAISIQKISISRRLKYDFGEDWQDKIIIVWFVDDAVSGDDPNRPALNEFFNRIDEFSYAYCMNVDRFSRSYLGLKWLNDYFLTDEGLSPHMGCRLQFCDGITNLYDKDGLINEDAYLAFFFLCGMAQGELIKIRKRAEAGRQRIRGTPEWKKKYPGRKKGALGKITRVNNGKRI